MPEAKLEAYVEAVTETFAKSGEEVQNVLSLIAAKVAAKANPLSPQLLALRRYLRLGDSRVHANWSWTAAETKQKATEEPAKTLYAEAEKVRKNFATQNPGYTLAVTPVRSLERQVVLWNKNSSVQRAGERLLTMMDAELAKADYPDPPTGGTVAKFSTVLRLASVTPEPTNAAPGTSDHGQGRAVDFIVMQGSTKVAGIETSKIASVWKALGWENKLIEACKGTRLRGPLKTPPEPWHWVLAH